MMIVESGHNRIDVVKVLKLSYKLDQFIFDLVKFDTVDT